MVSFIITDKLPAEPLDDSTTTRFEAMTTLFMEFTLFYKSRGFVVFDLAIFYCNFFFIFLTFLDQAISDQAHETSINNGGQNDVAYNGIMDNTFHHFSHFCLIFSLSVFPYAFFFYKQAEAETYRTSHKTSVVDKGNFLESVCSWIAASERVVHSVNRNQA